MSGEKQKDEETEVTQQVRTARDSMKLPTSELDAAILAHAEEASRASREAQATTRLARTRSISPAAFAKPSR